MYNKKVLLQSKPKNPNLWKRFKTYVVFCLSTSTICGLIHIVRPNRFSLERIFWLLFVAVGLGLTTRQSMDVWNHYQQNPVLTIVEKDFSNWNVSYPSVFWCHRNFSPDSATNNIIAALANKSHVDKDTFKLYLFDLMFHDYTTYYKLEMYANGLKEDYLPTNLYLEAIRKLTPVFVKKKSSALYYPILDQPGSFDPVFTEFGLCHVYHNDFAGYFHINNTSLKPIKYDYNKTNRRYDMDIGIATTFRVDISTNMFYGMVVGFNEWIDIKTKAFFGNSFDLVETAVEIISLGSEPELQDLNLVQRKCRMVQESDDLTYSPYYTYNLCRIDCRIKLCMQYCNCTPYYYKRKREPICNMKGLFCLSKYSDTIIELMDQNGTNLCSCLQSCDLQTAMPSLLSTAPFFIAGFKVNFYDFPNERYRRTLIFSKTDVLIQIGGFFGLFLGCSILSIVEVPYFLTFRFILDVISRKTIKPNL